MNVPILLNNRAGAFKAQVSLEQLEEMARAVGVEAEIIRTESVEEMNQTIRRLIAKGVKCLAVAGGDGTVARAVQELTHSGTALGIIPLGTANNFATALHLPQDLPAALRVLAEGMVLDVDLGKLNGRYFIEAAGIGLFADALALYGQGTNKNFFKAIYTLLRIVFWMRARRVRLVVDGKVHGERAVMCTVANTYRMGYALPLAPGAKVTDGELDVVIIGNLTLRELLPYYRAVRAQVHLNLPKVSTLRAREVRIETRRRLNVHCDDQVLRLGPAVVTVQPGALKVLVERL